MTKTPREDDHGPSEEITDQFEEVETAISTDYKVLGEKEAIDGTGVLGHNTATTGTSFGVEGATDSAETGAAGVRGDANASNGSVSGVRGSAPNSDVGNGVIGDAVSDSTNFRHFAEGFGVYGISDRQYGVFAYKPADNIDTGAALFARSDEAAPAIEALAFGSGDALVANGDVSVTGSQSVSGSQTVSGDQSVGGSQSVSSTGLSAYPSSNFTIPHGSTTTVLFDGFDVDDFGGLDTSTGVYTVQESGDYHVDFLIDWTDTFAEGDPIAYNLNLNGTSSGGFNADTEAATSGPICRGFSKALFGLSPGDTIDVAVTQNSGSDKDIFGGSSGETYLTIHKFG